MIIENKVEVLNKDESKIVKIFLIVIAILFLGVFLLLPLFTVFHQAFNKGLEYYFSSVSDPVAWAAIKLSLISTVIALVLNLIFGIAIAWSLTKYKYSGKGIFVTLLDLPFTISPVISGMMFILLLGINSYLGDFFNSQNIQIIFAIPGIVIATTFVTFPYIARELIPQMKEMGNEEEEAARLMGAGGWRIFFRITLPNIKWSLFYGIILCSARAMGEFGAVSVVSGHIRGLTNTIPLHIEILYNEYNFTAAFAVASLLTLLALVTLILKSIIEWNFNKKEQIK
jgi:sulfate/thiosulfate transport system permease protein